MLENGYHDIPKGKIAAVVTVLEMRAPAAIRPVPAPAGVTIARIEAPDPEWYRDLFRRVGGYDWLWSSRLELSDAELASLLNDADVHIYAARKDGVDEGIVELDFRTSGECELAFFGVTAPLVGTGTGRYLMNFAITQAWGHPIDRFHVHTCTLDHPAALSFYRRSGFAPICQKIEIMDDPRLSDLLPKSAGQHVPLFEA